MTQPPPLTSDNVAMRRKLRSDIRTLIDKTESHKNDFVNPNSDGLDKGLKEASALFEKVNKTREAAIDSEFMVISTDYAVKRAHNMTQSCLDFNAEFYLDKIGDILASSQSNQDFSKIVHQPKKHNWDKIGRMALSVISQRTICGTFMFGCLQVDETTENTKSNQRSRKKTTKIDIVKPLEGEEAERAAEALNGLVATEKVKIIHRELQKLSKPHCYFSFVCHPTSFIKTVENIFHTAFLVKDGWACIYVDQENNNGMPMIMYKKPYNKSVNTEKVQRKQVVLSITEVQYKEIVKAFDIKRIMIPDELIAEDNDDSSDSDDEGDNSSSGDDDDEGDNSSSGDDDDDDDGD